jgi:hypothetical protein
MLAQGIGGNPGEWYGATPRPSLGWSEIEPPGDLDQDLGNVNPGPQDIDAPGLQPEQLANSQTAVSAQDDGSPIPGVDGISQHREDPDVSGGLFWLRMEVVLASGAA